MFIANGLNEARIVCRRYAMDDSFARSQPLRFTGE